MKKFKRRVAGALVAGAGMSATIGAVGAILATGVGVVTFLTTMIWPIQVEVKTEVKK